MPAAIEATAAPPRTPCVGTWASATASAALTIRRKSPISDIGLAPDRTPPAQAGRDREGGRSAGADLADHDPLGRRAAVGHDHGERPGIILADRRERELTVAGRIGGSE